MNAKQRCKLDSVASGINIELREKLCRGRKKIMHLTGHVVWG
jgi:hypothetical protein